jgi:hypothetical protein
MVWILDVASAADKSSMSLGLKFITSRFIRRETGKPGQESQNVHCVSSLGKGGSGFIALWVFLFILNSLPFRTLPEFL